MKHIIISCQDHGMYQEIEDMLKANYVISAFPAGEADKSSNLTNSPDLILLTGVSMTQEILLIYDGFKKSPELTGIPVIILVRQSDTELEQQVLSLGVNDYIIMPISRQLLQHRIDTCIELVTLKKEKSFDEKYQDAVSYSLAELVECRDVTTGGHLKNTTRYFSILLTEVMNQERYQGLLPMENINDILRSVMLHDVGKIGINDEILRKESALDFHEFEYMKTHTTLGKQALENIIKETGGTRWLYLARDMAYCHHERWDGSGYPNGLKGEEIPLFARILTVADVYDALTSDRAYKKAYSHQKAMSIIIGNRGSMFDPDLVDLFVNVNEQFEEVLHRKCKSEALEKE